jgi:hypothetical protein
MPYLTDNPDNLEAFFEVVTNNQKANARRFPDAYNIVRRVNICLSTAGKHLVNPEPVMAGLLFLRCQYAYKTAVGLALAGQVSEAFVLTRSCLEYAGCAIIIFQNPALETTFMNRHAAAGGISAHRQAFHFGNMKQAISTYDTALATNFELFYQRSIDFGAHPNPHATFSTMQMTPGQEAQNSFTALAMVTDADVVRHALKSVAQVGLTGLFIFQRIFKAKFELLGIRQEMDALRTSGL